MRVEHQKRGSFAVDKDIKNLVCEACSEGAEKADKAQIDAFMGSHPEWEIKTESDTTFLTRTFNFHDFAEAADFAAQVMTSQSDLIIIPVSL